MNKLTKIVALTKTAQEQALVQAQVQETQSLIKAFQTGKMATLKKNSRFPETFASIFSIFLSLNCFQNNLIPSRFLEPGMEHWKERRAQFMGKILLKFDQPTTVPFDNSGNINT